MRHSQNRPIFFVILAAVISVFVAAPSNGFVRAGIAAERALSDAQLKKIDEWIADKGRDIAVSPVMTDILGLTKEDQTISCRAFAAEDAANGEIHQIYVLPEHKGYLAARFHEDRVEVYWTDQDLVLKAALSGVRGELPAATSFQDAQAGFGKEMAWWANYADTH